MAAIPLGAPRPRNCPQRHGNLNFEFLYEEGNTMYYRCPADGEIFAFHIGGSFAGQSRPLTPTQQKNAEKKSKKIRKAEERKAGVLGFEKKMVKRGFGNVGKIKDHAIEIGVALAIGIAISLFGYVFLGIAIALIGFYMIFRRTLLKGPFRFVIILLAAIQFILIGQNILALAILWIGYFLFPTSYDEEDLVKGMEAWLRFALGFVLSFILFFALGGTFSIESPQLPILIMSIAFFTTFPYIKAQARGVSVFVGAKGAIYGMAGRKAGAVWYSILMLIALGFIIATWGLALDAFGITFILFWVISFFFGLLAGRRGRPYVGVLMMVIALLIFSFQFTGIVGEAMFGAWWPQVQSTGEMLFGPIGPLFDQAGQGVSDAWLMMTCPQCYYEKQLQQQQAGTSNVKTGGTFKSIELTTFDLFSTILEPSESLLGYLELENQGEFNADRTKVTLRATWLIPTAKRGEEPTVVGKVGSMTCSDDITADKGKTSSCEWTETVYPTEIKTVSFRFDKNQWIGDDDVDLGKEIKKEGFLIYEHSTETVKIIADYNYDYNVNVSIPLEIINQSLYQTLLKNKQITLQQEESQYSGGPVKATIWTQKQPIRNREESLIVVSLLNEGKGKVTNVSDYTILVPENLNPEELQYSTFDGCNEEQEFEGGSRLGSEWADYMYISCSHSKSIDSGDFKRISFLIRPKIGSEVDKRTLLIIGKAKYTYSNSQEKTLQIANAPPTQ